MPWRAVLLFGVLTAAQLARQPRARSWNTIWAEDGRVFATDALGSGWTSSFLRGYGGYVQVVPRVLALPVRWLPPQWWAGWLAVASTVVTSALALFVLRASAPVVRSALLRLLLVAMTALAPSMWFEVNASVSNLGWPLLYAAFWAIVSPLPGRRAAAVRAAVLVAAALTTTVAALLLPIAAFYAWLRRSQRMERVIIGLFAAAMAVQLVAAHYAPPRPTAPSTAQDLPTLFAVRVLGSAVLGERWLERLWLHLHGAFPIIITILIVAAVVLAWRRIAPTRRSLIAVALGWAVVVFGTTVWLRGSEQMHLGAAYNSIGSRYVVVPALLVVTAAVLVVDGLPATRWTHCLVAAYGFVVIGTSLTLSGPRSDGPTWSAALATARAACAERNAPAVVQIAIAPPVEPWVVVAPCDRLR